MNCKGTTKAGKECRNSSREGSDYCYIHSKGQPYKPPPSRIPDTKCQIEGCDFSSRNYSMCPKHYCWRCRSYQPSVKNEVYIQFLPVYLQNEMLDEYNRSRADSMSRNEKMCEECSQQFIETKDLRVTRVISLPSHFFKLDSYNQEYYRDAVIPHLLVELEHRYFFLAAVDGHGIYTNRYLERIEIGDKVLSGLIQVINVDVDDLTPVGYFMDPDGDPKCRDFIPITMYHKPESYGRLE